MDEQTLVIILVILGVFMVFAIYNIIYPQKKEEEVPQLINYPGFGGNYKRENKFHRTKITIDNSLLKLPFNQSFKIEYTYETSVKKNDIYDIHLSKQNKEVICFYGENRKSNGLYGMIECKNLYDFIDKLDDNVDAEIKIIEINPEYFVLNLKIEENSNPENH